jgi:hypothetical protein
MLTVWRKLHIEFDSMTAEPATGAESSGWNAVIKGNDPVVGMTGLFQMYVVGPKNGRKFYQNGFENGRIIIGSAQFAVVSSLLYDSPQGEAHIRLLVTNFSGPNVLNLNATIHDDDNTYLQDSPLYPSLLDLPHPLPAHTRSAEFSTNIQPAFAQAYIDIVDANSKGWNTAQTIPFKRKADLAFSGNPSPEGDFDFSKLSLLGKDRAGFWAYSIALAYEPGPLEDRDPDITPPLKGNNPKLPVYLTSRGLAVIYVETIRDDVYSPGAKVPIPRDHFVRDESGNLQGLRRDYLGLLYGTIAHELGHCPGGQPGDIDPLLRTTDHSEGDLMIEGGSDIFSVKFSAKTILRFRKTPSWRDE